MQYLILGYDGKDPEAKQRRLKARPAHLALGDKMVAEGKLLFGVAMLDDKGDMTGSALVGDFMDRAELDAWLEKEPYVTGKVWERVEVTPCKVGPSFERVLGGVERG